jgi:hypothetical protein
MIHETLARVIQFFPECLVINSHSRLFRLLSHPLNSKLHKSVEFFLDVQSKTSKLQLHLCRNHFSVFSCFPILSSSITPCSHKFANYSNAFLSSPSLSHPFCGSFVCHKQKPPENLVKLKIMNNFLDEFTYSQSRKAERFPIKFLVHNHGN